MKTTVQRFELSAESSKEMATAGNFQLKDENAGSRI
jgi:hypothetical protein